MTTLALFSSAPRSLCVLRLSAIGDVCHTVALVQAIQRQWPTTQITWIMGKVEASLLGDLPGIETIIFDKKQGWQAYRSVWRQLHGRHFDALLHVQAALRASILSLGIKARYKLGFDRQRANDAQWLFTNHKVASPAAPHVVDGLMAFAAALGVNDVTPRWDVPVAPADDEWAASVLGSKASMIIVPGSSKPYKNWTVAGYAAVADHAAQAGLQVVLCGSSSPAEQALAAQVEQACSCTVLNLTGKTSLKQMLALIRRAQLLLAPDSGPVHMATLVGTPVIALYAHHNPARVGPYGGQENVVSIYQTLVESEHAQALDTLPWRTRVKDEAAMELISTGMVVQAFERLWSRLQKQVSHASTV